MDEKQQEIKELEILLKELVKVRNEKTNQINENFQEEKDIAKDFKADKGNEQKQQRFIQISKQTSKMERELIELNQTIENTNKRLEDLFKK